MRRLVGIALLVSLFVCGCSENQCCNMDKEKGDKMLAHNVYFTLTDDSAAAKEELVEQCHKYLKDHPGVVFFAAGSLAEELDREVNDRDFDVALHVVFENQAYQDQYQVAESHIKFIEANKSNWAKVRVFDSIVK